MEFVSGIDAEDTKEQSKEEREQHFQHAPFVERQICSDCLIVYIRLKSFYYPQDFYFYSFFYSTYKKHIRGERG